MSTDSDEKLDGDNDGNIKSNIEDIIRNDLEESLKSSLGELESSIVEKKDDLVELDDTIGGKMDDSDILRLEEIILRIIKRIRESRSRPGFQNILTFVNRGGEFNLSMDYLKNILCKMVDENKICIKGKEKSESFYILDKTEEIKPVDVKDKTEEIKPVDIKDASKLDNSIHDYINEQFHVTLAAMIKREVNVQLNVLDNKEIFRELIKDEIHVAVSKLSSFNASFNSNDSNQCKHNCSIDRKVNDTLLSTLNSEIAFLRSELSSKNKTIELLINDRSIAQSELRKGLLNDLKTVNSDNHTVGMSSDYNKRKNISTANQDGEKSNVVDNNKFIKVKAKNNARSISIIGDSIIKGMDPFKMKKSLPSKDKLYVKTFPGATIDDMKVYAIPTMKREPDLIILHCGTNNLPESKEPKVIAEEIINLAVELKTDDNEVMISGLTMRKDKHQDKGEKVNDYLKIKSSEIGLSFIDNSNLILNSHFNSKGIHLNFKGTQALANNFMNAIKI